MVRKKRSEVKPPSKEQIDELFATDNVSDKKVEKASSDDERNEDTSALPPVAAHIFEEASGMGRAAFPKIPDIKEGFIEIVRDLFEGVPSIHDEYLEIKSSLSVKGSLTPGSVKKAANNAEQMADRAFRLYCVGRVEYEAYLREIAVIEAALRDAAVDALEQQKAKGKRTKQITDADVLSEISQRYPDEWNDVQDRKLKVKMMSKYLTNLSELSKSRCFTLSNLQKD